jgi:DNA replication and repair protein RecF
MHLTRFSLTNFRNYIRLSLDMPQHTIILQGANAQGKTNLLEGIYYLAIAKSPYATNDAQLVNWLAAQDDLPHARIEADLAHGNTQTRIEITLARPKKASTGYRKHVRINGLPKRVTDLIGQVNIVLFVPQDITLLDGPPSERRRYLDVTLCQIDRPYYRALTRYNRVLERRNHLLRTLRERGGSLDQLDFWDQELAEHGALIIARRQKAVIELETWAQPVHLDLSGGLERLRLRYLPSFDPRRPPEDDLQMSLGLDLPPPISTPQEPAAICPAFLERLRATRAREVQRGLSLTGPHRDDVRFLDGQIDLHLYGSRGQQRTAVLALKLAEMALMNQVTGERPILLLDEVMSELDANRRRYLCAQLDQVEQAIITTTDLDALTPQIIERAAVYRISKGHLEQTKS